MGLGLVLKMLCKISDEFVYVFTMTNTNISHKSNAQVTPTSHLPVDAGFPFSSANICITFCKTSLAYHLVWAFAVSDFGHWQSSWFPLKGNCLPKNYHATDTDMPFK